MTSKHQIPKYENVYKLTEQGKWSESIKERRLRWFGHLARLPARTPACRALDEALYTNTKKPRGGQKMTWLQTIGRDLEMMNMTIQQAIDVAENRRRWREMVGEVVKQEEG